MPSDCQLVRYGFVYGEITPKKIIPLNMPLFRLLLSCLASASALSLSAQIQTVATGLDSDWSLAAWGGLAVEETADGSDRVIAVKVISNAEAWAGFNVSPSWEKPATFFLPITPEKVAHGALTLEFNGGTTIAGEIRGGQQLQFSVTLTDNVGNELEGRGFIAFDQYAEADLIDTDPATWQKIRIPLAGLVGSQTAAAAAGLKKISIQYVGDEEPVAGFLVRNINIESPADDPATSPPAATAEIK